MTNSPIPRRDFAAIACLTAAVLTLMVYALTLPDVPSAAGQVVWTPGPATGFVRGRAIDTTSLKAYAHACRLVGDGTASCWGANNLGQLGDGTVDPRTSPVTVWNTGSAFTAVATGGAHSCGLNSSGAAYCWGDASMGQIGDGLMKSPVSGSMGQGGQLQMVPARVTGGISFANIAAGTNHSCGVTTDGAAWCWGDKYALGATVSNTWSMVGSTSNVPVKVSGTLRFKPETLAAGGSTCAITTSGTPYCWGAINMWDRRSDMPFTEPVAVDGSGSTITGQTSSFQYPAIAGPLVKLTVGAYHACGLTAAGKAYCWGDNSNGQIGNGVVGNPPPVYTYTAPIAVAGGLSFSAIDAGVAHTCATTSAGAVYCWGANGYGQLGDGTTTPRPSPVQVVTTGSTVSGMVAVPTVGTFSSVQAYGNHTCAITSSGANYCWGSNRYGQLGIGEWGYDGGPQDRWFPVLLNAQVVTPPSSVEASQNVRLANVRDTSFTVTWTTPTAVTGAIRWGPASGTPITTATDKRGAIVTSTVHYVTVSGVMPSTSYAFDIVSGTGVDNNVGAHYTVTTGPTLPITSPSQAFGTVTLRDGTTPTGAIVFVTASTSSSTSSPLATLVTSDEQKAWLVDLANLRSSSLTSTVTVTDDTSLTVFANGGLDGSASTTITGATARSGTIALTLADEVRQPLQAGWNLIGPQVNPGSNLTAAAVCASLNVTTTGTAVEIARWTAGAWESHLCGLPPNDFQLTLGNGYFIRLTAPATWTYRGTAAASPQMLTLSTGWNLVSPAVTSGAPSTAAASCTTFNATPGTAVELDRWVAGGWDGHRCGLPPNDFTLQLGQAVFVRLTRSTTWSPTGSAPMSASSLRRIVATPTPNR